MKSGGVPTLDAGGGMPLDVSKAERQLGSMPDSLVGSAGPW